MVLINLLIKDKETSETTLTTLENRNDLVTALNESELDKLNHDLMDDVIETPYTSKRMVLIGQKYELETQEVQEISKIIKEYLVKPNSIEKFLEAGIQVQEIESFIYVYKKINEGGIEFMSKEIEPLSKGEKGIHYFVPNASNCISYDNLLFIQKLINGNADQVDDAIYSVNLIDQDLEGFGIGITLNRMRELYENYERYRGLSLEMLTYAALNKIPNINFEE